MDGLALLLAATFNAGTILDGTETVAQVGARISSGLNVSLGASLSRNRDDRQWYGNITDEASVTHYTFAHLEQETLALTGRLDFTATPNLTLQLKNGATVLASEVLDENVRVVFNGSPFNDCSSRQTPVGAAWLA